MCLETLHLLHRLFLTLTARRQLACQTLRQLDALCLLFAQACHPLLGLLRAAVSNAKLRGNAVVGSLALLQGALQLRCAIHLRARTQPCFICCLALTLDQDGHDTDGLLLHLEGGLAEVEACLLCALLCPHVAKPTTNLREVCRRRDGSGGGLLDIASRSAAPLLRHAAAQHGEGVAHIGESGLEVGIVGGHLHVGLTARHVCVCAPFAFKSFRATCRVDATCQARG